MSDTRPTLFSSAGEPPAFPILTGTRVVTLPSEPPPPPRRTAALRGVGDRTFHGLSWAGGLSVLAVMSLVGIFLTFRGVSALRATGFSFITTSDWDPDSHRFGIAAVLTFTVLIALVALVVAV